MISVHNFTISLLTYLIKGDSKMLIKAFCHQSFRQIDLNSVFEYYDYYQKFYRNTCVSTISERHLYLNRFFSWCNDKIPDSEFYSLDYFAVRSFINYYSGKYSPGSMDWMIQSLRSFFNFCFINEQLKSNFHALISCRHKYNLAYCPQTLTREQICKVLNSIDRTSFGGKRDYALIFLLVHYGIRGIQLRELKLSDIDWDNELINFPAVKGEDLLQMPLIPEAGNIISDYILKSRPSETGSDNLFMSISKPFHPLKSSSSTSSVAAKYFKKSGIKFDGVMRGGTHIFRHSFAGKLLQKNEPFKNISDMLGHKSLESTMIYTKIDITGLQNAVQKWEE
jgi:integrase/recombinase XerD